MVRIKAKPIAFRNPRKQTNINIDFSQGPVTKDKQIEQLQKDIQLKSLEQQYKSLTPEYQKQLQAEKRQADYMKDVKSEADFRQRQSILLQTAKQKKEYEIEKELEKKAQDARLKRLEREQREKTYKDIFEKYQPVQTKEAETAMGRIGQKFSKGYKDITGITQAETRARQAELATALQQQIAVEKGQVPDYLMQAEIDAQKMAQGGVIQKPSYTRVVPVSGLAQYGQTISKNIGFQGAPSYDVQNLERQAGVYLGTDVFSVANPSLPSYAQQAEKARVLTGQSTGAGARSPLDTIRDATGVVMQQQIARSNTDKIKDLTGQPIGMELSPQDKIRMFTGGQSYQPQYEIGQPLNPMGIQFQQQPYYQRTIDPYQQQMMQEMRAQRAAERQQQRAVEDQIVRQKVVSMNNIGNGVNVGMAGGVNLNKQFGSQQSDEYVPSPREAGVTTPASRPVTYRRGPYQKHQ